MRMSLLEEYAAAVERGGNAARLTALLRAGAFLAPLDRSLVLLYVRNRWQERGRAWPFWLASVRRTAIRERWPRESSIDRLAGDSLTHWLTNVCPACEGRRFERAPGAPCTLATACASCGSRGWLSARVCGYIDAERVDALQAQLDANLQRAASVLHARFNGLLGECERIALEIERGQGLHDAAALG